MEVIVLGGFLGSGKTTCLMKIARYLVANCTSDRSCKLMIIENEIGSVGVDDTLIGAAGYEIRSLFSGCACCTLTGDLVDMVQNIRQEYDPAYLIVEASGVALPENIRETLQTHLEQRVRTVVLADSSRWKKLLAALQMVIPYQLEKADVVLLNKADLVDNQTLSEVERSVREFAPEALVMSFCAAGAVTDAVLAQITGGGR